MEREAFLLGVRWLHPCGGFLWTSTWGWLPLWRANKGLAIDVAVTCPLASSFLNDPKHCETYAEVKKHAYYDEGFKGTRFEFAAMVFETTGGTNEEGLEVLRRLFRFAAKHQNVQLSVYCGRAWARLACNIQSSVSQCFLNRAGSLAAVEKDSFLSGVFAPPFLFCFSFFCVCL